MNTNKNPASVVWICRSFVIVVCVCFAKYADAQWTVTNLHPAGATESVVWGVAGANQVGQARVGGVYRASRWSGTAASWVDLSPVESVSSQAFGAGETYQVGQATVGGVGRASLWSGTADSWVDLHPAGASDSLANSVSGENQVGAAATPTGGYHASLWSGTAASWVDLNPAGATSSVAYAVSGEDQVGYAVVGGSFRASLWSGTAASWVDLNPAGSAMAEANGVIGPNQVGWALVGGVGRASLWSGTAASWVDLHPAGMEFSQLYAAFGPYQVGYVDVGTHNNAGVWSGTAASWVDLHALLPAEFINSSATCISSDGTNYYVGGYGYNTQAGRREALLWTQPVPTPTVVAPDQYNVFRGFYLSGDLSDSFESDDSYLKFNPGMTINSGEAPVWLIFDGTLPNNNPVSLQIVMESTAGTPGLTHTLEAWNWTSMAYDVVDVSAASFNDDVVVTIDLSSQISDYAQPGTGSVRTRVGWRKTGPINNYPWEVRLDQMAWIVQ